MTHSHLVSRVKINHSLFLSWQLQRVQSHQFQLLAIAYKSQWTFLLKRPVTDIVTKIFFWKKIVFFILPVSLGPSRVFHSPVGVSHGPASCQVPESFVVPRGAFRRSCFPFDDRYLFGQAYRDRDTTWIKLGEKILGSRRWRDRQPDCETEERRGRIVSSYNVPIAAKNRRAAPRKRMLINDP